MEMIMMEPSALPPPVAARRLLRSLDRAVLATALVPALGGGPYASLVLAATAADGAPLLLISDLAQHTVNIAAEPGVALLLDGTAGYDEPLTGPRLTVLGHAERSADARLRARFLARHPSTARHAGFADFHLYRVAAARAHLVAGFGRIDWIEAGDLLPPSIAALAAAEDGIVVHMNEDHAEAAPLSAKGLLARPGARRPPTATDPHAPHLRRAPPVARLDFAAPVGDAQQARAALVALAQQARAG